MPDGVDNELIELKTHIPSTKGDNQFILDVTLMLGEKRKGDNRLKV